MEQVMEVKVYIDQKSQECGEVYLDQQIVTWEGLTSQVMNVEVYVDRPSQECEEGVHGPTSHDLTRWGSHLLC